VLSNRESDSYANVLGGAMSHDGYHLTSIDPARTQVDGCVRAALRNAGLDSDQVRYVNAHGPGTEQCDAAERAIVDTILGGAPEIYSVKPLTGHCQGAAAAVEVAAAALGYVRGVVPAPPIVAPAHPQLLDGPTPMSPGITLKTSLGMGGHNSAVLLGPSSVTAN
jgi:3-oxoacyl-[acyl-carrier-protein] synthase II